MIDCNCTGPGYCEFYKLRLTGRQYLVSHELEGTPEEQAHYKKLLLNLGARTTRPLTVVSVNDDSVTVTKPAKKCCGKK